MAINPTTSYEQYDAEGCDAEIARIEGTLDGRVGVLFRVTDDHGSPRMLRLFINREHAERFLEYVPKAFAEIDRQTREAN